jgi:hypothetical protein
MQSAECFSATSFGNPTTGRKVSGFHQPQIDEHRVTRGGSSSFSASKATAFFFSDETLAQRGESDYAAAINAALDTAQILVILATSADDFRSGWVDYEWKSFLNEILSGRKPNGQIFSLLSGVQVAELPFALRSRQMVPFSPLAPHDAFENLKRFIDPVLAR